MGLSLVPRNQSSSRLHSLLATISGQTPIHLIEHPTTEEVAQRLVLEQLIDEVAVLLVAVDQRVVQGLAERDREVAFVVHLGRLLEVLVSDELLGDAVDQILGVEVCAEAFIDDVD